jgi:hypothetical protein
MQYEILSLQQSEEASKLCDMATAELRKQLVVDYGLKEEPMLIRRSGNTESIIACSFEMFYKDKSASWVLLYQVFEKDLYVLTFVEK